MTVEPDATDVRGHQASATLRLRTAMRRLGAVAGVGVVVGTALAPRPASATGVVVVWALLTVGLVLWAVVLFRPGRNVAADALCLGGFGLAGAGMNLVQPHGPGFLAAFVSITAIGLTLPRRLALVVGSVVVVATAVGEARSSDSPVSAVLNLGLGAMFLFASSAFAAVSRDAEEQAVRLAREQAANRAAREENAVLAERARLARDLHDILAHALSGLTVQLEGARLLAAQAETDPRLVAQIETARSLARDGMAGARRAVAALRGESSPGPDAIGDLIASVRSTGDHPIRLVEVGRPRQLPADLGLCVYRAVQEGLSNVTRHAPAGAGVEVRVEYRPDCVVTSVTDSGGSTPKPHLPTSGSGLAGLGERAALFGGRVRSGPLAEGGWRLTVTLPDVVAGPV